MRIIYNNGDIYLRFNRADLFVVTFMCLDDHVINDSRAFSRAEDLYRTRTRRPIQVNI